MSKLKAWLYAARLRTLPLSISGILVGTALAHYVLESDPWIFLWSMLTAIGFQVTSNLANDYGDGVKGVDNKDRIGPKRALQSGLLNRRELKNGIVVSVILNLLLVILLLWSSFGSKYIEYFLLFFVLGIMSIWAAIRYTVGTSAYGYRGMGDLFVFIFFGIVAVLGALFLHTKMLFVPAILPAIAIGLLSTGVLNLNNLRDYGPDKKSGKNTLVVKIGYKNAKIYHYILLGMAMVAMVTFIWGNHTQWIQFIPIVAFVPILVHLLKVHRIERPEDLDPELKKLSLSTFLLAILFFLVYFIFF